MASPVFCFLNHEEVGKIDKNRIEVSFNPGDTIMKSGAPKTHVMSFYHGLAKVALEGKDKKKFILDFIRPQTFFSGPGFFFEKKHYLTITAVEPCKVCLIDIDVFLQLMKDDFEIAFAFMENSNKFILNLIHKMESLLIKHHHGRVAEALLYLSGDIYQSNPFNMSISRQDLSDFTALPKESVSRIIQEFENDGIISVKSNNVHILKEESLMQISYNG